MLALRALKRSEVKGWVGGDLGWSSASAQRFSSPGSCDSKVSLPDGSGPCAGASETLQSLGTCPSCGVTPASHGMQWNFSVSALAD